MLAFGFGADHDAALLGELSERARTPFTYVEDTSKIREAFAGACGGLSSVMAQGVELTLDCSVTLKQAHTPFAIRRESGGARTVISIPDMLAGERRDILVELAPATTTTTTDLLQASLRYTDLQRGCLVQSSAVMMSITRVDEPQPELEPDEEVVEQRHRVEVTRALQAATAQGDAGDFEQAQKLITTAEQRLAASGKQSSMKQALGGELADAKCQMRNRSVWERGGRAELCDAVQMHRVQRCSMATSNVVGKSSRAMYASKVQSAWIGRSG